MYTALFSIQIQSRVKKKIIRNQSGLIKWNYGIIGNYRHFLFSNLYPKRKFLSFPRLKATRRAKRRNKITFIFKAAPLSVEWKAMREGGRERGEKPFRPGFLVQQRIRCMSLIVRCVAKLLADVRIIGPATEFLVVEGTLINVYMIYIYIYAMRNSSGHGRIDNWEQWYRGTKFLINTSQSFSI